MDLEKIEGLVKIIEDSSLNEFTYKDKDVKITMSKLDHPPVVAAGVPVAASAPVNTTVEKAEEEEEESLFITSPIVGTFYSAAAPDVPAFVKVGDQVKAGDVLLEFDLEEITKAGYDVTTPIVITNLGDYKITKCLTGQQVKAGEEVIQLTKQ